MKQKTWLKSEIICRGAFSESPLFRIWNRIWSWVSRATNGEWRTTSAGTTTLEVIAALVIFALAAAGLAVALPMAFDNAETWSEQQTLAWYLEKSMEEIRGFTYESLPVGSDTLTAETLRGRQLQASYTTSLAVDTLNAANQRVWTDIAGPMGAPLNGLLGTYYDNIDFTGNSVVKVDSTVNFNWGSDSPVAGIEPDTFSVEWTGFVETPQASGGKFTFYTSSDDGVKLWINDTLVIDNWTDHSETEDSGAINLKAGKKYKISLRMYENGGAAVASLSWEGPSISKQIIPVERLYNNLPKKVALTVSNSVSGTTKAGDMLIFPPYLETPLETTDDSGDFQGLAGLYFDSIDFSSANSTFPYALINTYSRIDPIIDFTWADSSVTNSTKLLPTGIGPDDISIRWTGYLTPKDNTNYYFHITSHDGVKLWIDHELLIDAWNSMSEEKSTGWNDTYLSNDQLHTVTLDYHYHTANPNNSRVILKWNKHYYDTPEIIPEELLYPVFSPVEDSYVDSQNRTTNYGTETTLLLSKRGNNNTKSVYLKFKIAGLAGKTVKSATLRLYSQARASLDFVVKKVDAPDSWNERTLNYNNAVANGTYATYNATTNKGFFDITLDPAMFSAGNGVYGMALVPSGNCEATFYSREIEYVTTQYSNTSDWSPRLVLLFEKSAEEYNDAIKIEYLANNTSTTTNTLAPRIKITNIGTMPIDLEALTIRYWYTRETNVTQNAHCDWAGLVSGDSTTSLNNVTTSCIAMSTPASLANYYMEIGFSSQRYLPVGAYVILYNRIWNQNWTNYTQTNDYSYDPAFTSFGENTKITAYMGEELFFGVEP
jgi:type II secretory pathway pseudopilin PulG